jgi:hypothetical protein
MMIRRGRVVESAHGGTRRRIIECRRRLRQTRRATLIAQRLAQDETVSAASELLPVVIRETDFAASEEIFEEAGAVFAGKSRQFASAVDRRAGLRAR